MQEKEDDSDLEDESDSLILRDDLSNNGEQNNTESAEQGNTRSTMFYLKQPAILTNLVIMTINWTSCSFIFYMQPIMVKYMPGNFDNNSMALLSS